MPSNVLPFPAGPRWRVLIAHRLSAVRHVLRTLVEAETIAVVEAADGDEALAALESRRFDLLVLELDLPIKDGVTVMQLDRVLLAHEHIRLDAPAVVFTLPPEVRCNTTLTDHLRTLGAAGIIDDAPRPEAASLIESILLARAAELTPSKSAAA